MTDNELVRFDDDDDGDIVVVRSDRERSRSARVDAIEPHLVAFGFAAVAPDRWRFDARSGGYAIVRIERLDGAESFDRLRCTLQIVAGLAPCEGIVLALGARLGWEVFRVEDGTVLRDALPPWTDELPSFARRTKYTEPKALPLHEEKVIALEPIDDTRCYVCWFVDDETWGYETRAGALLQDLERASQPDYAPTVFGPTWTLGTKPGDDDRATTRVHDPDTDALVRRFPLTCATWLPDWTDAFVGLTRKKLGEKLESLVEHPVIDRLGEGPRLVVADARTGDVFPLAADEIVGTTWKNGKVQVTGDGEHVLVISDVALHVFSLSTGELVARRKYPGNPVLAVSACGRYAATASKRWVIVTEILTGKCLLNRPAVFPSESIAFHPSGWIAVGDVHGNVTVYSLDGASWKDKPTDNPISTVLFHSGRYFALAEKRQTIFSRKLLPEEDGSPVLGARVPASERAARIRAFDFTTMEPRIATGTDGFLLGDIVGTYEQNVPKELTFAEQRLSTANDAEVEQCAVDACGTDDFARWGASRAWFALKVLARRCKAAGRPFPPRGRDVLDRLVREKLTVQPVAIATLRGICEALTPDERAAVLFHDGTPGWGRFLVDADDASFDAFVAYLRTLDARASKRFAPRPRGGIDGATETAFVENAVAALVTFGAEYVPKLDAILAEDGPFPYRSVLTKARKRILEKAPKVKKRISSLTKS